MSKTILILCINSFFLFDLFNLGNDVEKCYAVKLRIKPKIKLKDNPFVIIIGDKQNL